MLHCNKNKGTIKTGCVRVVQVFTKPGVMFMLIGEILFFASFSLGLYSFIVYLQKNTNFGMKKQR